MNQLRACQWVSEDGWSVLNAEALEKHLNSISVVVTRNMDDFSITVLKWQSINCYLLDEDRYDDSSILQVLRYG